MWTRAQLKEKAKIAFKKNYWKTILVALIAAGILSGSGSGIFNYSFDKSDFQNSASQTGEWNEDQAFQFGHQFFGDVDPAVIGFFAISVSIFVLVAIAIGITMKILLINPLEMGTKRFFFLNLNQEADVKEIAYGFDRSYKNVIKVMFFRDLYIFLWSLLLIIPGIIKTYEYRMMPYLLSEYPDMPMEQVFETSKRMMRGQKWRAFVLDLSFIGWYLLSIITIGIVAVFYAAPYQMMTSAALYEALRYTPNTGFVKETGVEDGVYNINC